MSKQTLPSHDQPHGTEEPCAWRVRRYDSPSYWIVFLHKPVDAMKDPEREVQPLYTRGTAHVVCEWPVKPLSQVQVMVDGRSVVATPERAYFDAHSVNEAVKAVDKAWRAPYRTRRRAPTRRRHG